MKTEEIINRAAYEIGDENFKVITKDEWLKMLRRVYRDFCETTKLLRTTIEFVCTGAKDYKLYGMDQNGATVGDNFLGSYRAEYNGHKAFETDYDTLKLLRHGAEDMVVNHGVLYVIDYKDQYLWVHFAHIPASGDTFKLWCYVMPRITDLADFDSVPLIDLKYHDDLVGGLIVRGWKRRYVKSTDNTSSAYAKLFKDEYGESKLEWLTRLKKIEQEVMSYKDDTIPIIVMPALPFDYSFDDNNNEIDQDLL